MNRGLICCTAALLLGGCASVPKTISTPVVGPDVREVRANPDANIGKTVRWGGTISDVENLENRTVITVVARRLTSRGEPEGDTAAIGRFKAEVNRFLEPEEYKPGRRITVVGRVSAIRQDRIDQYVYNYPVVEVQSLYVWEEYKRYREPYPYYGWPYPYWRYPYSWHYRHFHPWYY